AWLAIGMLGGCAILLKQHAALVLTAFVAWNALTTWRVHHSVRAVAREVGLLVLGALLPALAFAVYQLALAGSLHDFLYWTLVFNVTSGYGAEAALAPNAAQIRLLAAGGLLLPW